MNSSAPTGGSNANYAAAASASGFKTSNYGFQGGMNKGVERGASIVMNATSNDNEGSSEPLVSDSKTEEGKLD